MRFSLLQPACFTYGKLEWPLPWPPSSWCFLVPVGLCLEQNGFGVGPIAVVRTGAESLRKIPEPLATDWIRLPAGTSLRVLAEEGENRLVRTGYGLEGWLPSSSLLIVENDSDGL